jgi:hypothetical protein
MTKGGCFSATLALCHCKISSLALNLTAFELDLTAQKFTTQRNYFQGISFNKKDGKWLS